MVYDWCIALIALMAHCFDVYVTNAQPAKKENRKEKLKHRKEKLKQRQEKLKQRKKEKQNKQIVLAEIDDSRTLKLHGVDVMEKIKWNSTVEFAAAKETKWLKN